MKVAVLGIGRMGRELVLHILEAGHDVSVYNRTPANTADAVEAGATLAKTPTAAISAAEVVVTVLFGPDVVRELVIAENLRFPSGTLWIDVTTIGPNDADEFAAWSAARDIRYVHSPVLGSLAPARAGALGVLLGGESAAVDAATRITDLWTDPARVHRFATPRQAAAAKLAVNLGLAVSIQGLAEALAVAGSSGLSQDAVLLLMDKTPLGAIAAAKGDTLRGGSFTEAQFTVDALAKDARLAREASAVPLPALESAAAALAVQQASGHGAWDFSVIASSPFHEAR